MGDRPVKFIAGWSPSSGEGVWALEGMIQPALIVNTSYDSSGKAGEEWCPLSRGYDCASQERRGQVRPPLAAEGGSDSCAVALDPDPPSVTPVPDTSRSFGG